MQVTRGLGFSLLTDELPPGFVVRDETDRRIDFHPVRFRSDGSAVQQGIRGEWVFSAPGLRGTGSINGRSIRCLTPEEQAVRAIDQPGEAAGSATPHGSLNAGANSWRERYSINELEGSGAYPGPL